MPLGRETSTPEGARSAALQLAASRFAFEVLSDVALGSRLANDSRQNLLAGYELCARKATARRLIATTTPSWMRPAGEDSDR